MVQGGIKREYDSSEPDNQCKLIQLEIKDFYFSKKFLYLIKPIKYKKNEIRI